VADKTPYADLVSIVNRLWDLKLIPKHIYDSLMEHGEDNIYSTKRNKSGNRIIKKASLYRRMRQMPGLFTDKGKGVIEVKTPEQIKSLGVYKWFPEDAKTKGYRSVTNSIGNRFRQIKSTGTESDIREAEYVYNQIRDAESVDDLRRIREDLGWGRRAYSPERAELYGIRVDKKKYKSDDSYRLDINQKIKATVNRDLKASQRKELEESGGHSGYQRLLTMSNEAYAKKTARKMQEHMLVTNPDLLPEGMRASEWTGQWWDSLPDAEKQKWLDLATPIHEYNKSVISQGLNKETGLLQSVPDTGQLLQWHHMLPRSFGGENTPENIRAALGDAFAKIDDPSEHSILHGADPSGEVGSFSKGPIEDFYKFMQSRGATRLNYAPPIESMPASPLSGRWPIQPRGDVPGVPAYHPLPEELRGGGSPTMGWSNAPADAIPRSLIKVDLGRLSQQQAMNEAKYLETYGKDQADYEERRKRGLLGRAPWRGFPGLTFVGGGGKR